MNMPSTKRVTLIAMLIFPIATFLAACGGAGAAPEPEIIVKDVRQIEGKRTSNAIPFRNNADTTVITDLSARIDYRHTIKLNMVNTRVNEQTVRDKIYQLYKISDVNDTKICLVPAEVPPGMQYDYQLEWIEVWREGVIEEGQQGGGQQLGTYQLFESVDCQVVGLDVYPIP